MNASAPIPTSAPIVAFIVLTVGQKRNAISPIISIIPSVCSKK